ncbi:MAG: hypothetical protein FWF24_07160 [Alphaproteobacteria bacterium]|nr:hypothetical protein [Alphaproteobacteria bacterium]
MDISGYGIKELFVFAAGAVTFGWILKRVFIDEPREVREKKEYWRQADERHQAWLQSCTRTHSVLPQKTGSPTPNP